MVLALVRLGWREGRRGLRGPAGSTDAWLLAAAGCWLVACAKFKLEPVTALAGALVVGACVLPLRPGPLVRVLEWRPLAAVGVASYSLYLWHAPIVIWLGGGHYDGAALRFTVPGWSFPGLLAVALPLAIAVALVSYRVIEAPFLRLRRRWSPAAAEAAPAAQNLPVATQPATGR
jgi:peptidoglycan/LPS O-acetylase OafA/YrhL